MEDSGRRSQGLAPTDASPTPPSPGGAGAPPSGSGSGPRPSLIADDAGLVPGMLLGKYQIVKRLGSGGMGTVYEAVHRDIAKPVALKTLAARLASEPAAQARFLREAASASRLTHPHVVDVTDFGSDGGVTFLVMELLRGEDLAAALAREPGGMAVDRIADIMLAVCAGVFAAHEAGVIHRDLKPPNIFLSISSLEEMVPKVLDFGISKLLDEQMSTTLTGTGTVMGTTPYLSPEQVAGRPVDARSDQYTLGVILYECLCGHRPHQGETLFTIMRSIADGRFVRPRDHRPDTPAAFESLIMRAMSLEPGRRFETVHALGHALLPFASQRRRVLWSEYFGVDRTSKRDIPLPRTEPLPMTPDAGSPVVQFAQPLASTRSRERPTPIHSTNIPIYTTSGPVPVLRPPSRAPWVVVGLLLAAGAGLGAYVMTREPPRQIQVEVPRPVPPSPVRPIADPPPLPPPPAVEPQALATPGIEPRAKAPEPTRPRGDGKKKPRPKLPTPRPIAGEDKPKPPPVIDTSPKPRQPKADEEAPIIP